MPDCKRSVGSPFELANDLCFAIMRRRCQSTDVPLQRATAEIVIEKIEGNYGAEGLYTVFAYAPPETFGHLCGKTVIEE